jgi:hypothetical protein
LESVAKLVSVDSRKFISETASAEVASRKERKVKRVLVNENKTDCEREQQQQHLHNTIITNIDRIIRTAERLHQSTIPPKPEHPSKRPRSRLATIVAVHLILTSHGSLCRSRIVG